VFGISIPPNLYLARLKNRTETNKFRVFVFKISSTPMFCLAHLENGTEQTDCVPNHNDTKIFTLKQFVKTENCSKILLE